MKNFKKHSIFISGICLFIGWIMYVLFFQRFYTDAIDFGIGESSIVMRILLIVKYRGDELIKILISGFLWITLSFYYLLILYYKVKQQYEPKKGDQYLLIGSAIVILGFIVGISFNILGMIWIALILISFSIVYVSYLIAKNTIGKRIRINEEIIGSHGPFLNKQEAKEYIEILKEENDISTLSEQIYEENNEWYVDYTG